MLIALSVLVRQKYAGIHHHHRSEDLPPHTALLHGVVADGSLWLNQRQTIVIHHLLQAFLSSFVSHLALSGESSSQNHTMTPSNTDGKPSSKTATASLLMP